MKKPARSVTLESLRQDYPVDAQVPGWLFRVREVSAGVYRAEGRDRFGRTVGQDGQDPGLLLLESARRARDVLRRLRVFGDWEEFYAGVDTLCQDLRRTGHAQVADRITDAIRSGSVGSEILGALRQELLAAPQAITDTNLDTRKRLEFFVAEIDRALGGRGFV